MTDPIPPSSGKRRLLLAGAGVGGPLIGLLLLMTVCAGGNDVAVGVAPAAVPRQAQSTTVPVSTTLPDEDLLLAATSDPFRQLVTVPDPTQPGDGPPILGTSDPQPAVSGVVDAGTVIGAPLADAPFPFTAGGPSSPVRDQTVGVSPAVSDGTVSQTVAPDATSSPPTTEPPGPTPVSTSTTIAPPTTTIPPTTSVPPTTTIPPTTIPPATIPPASTTTSAIVGAAGRGIVFAGVSDGNQDIYSVDPADGGQRRLTNDRAADREPSWSPDGTKIAFVSDRASRPELFVMRADGTAQTQVTAGGGSPARPTWGRDGQSLVFESTEVATGNRELFVLTLSTSAGSPSVLRRLTAGACTGTPTRVCPDGDIAHGQPAFSLDGTRITFVRSDRTGQHVLVMNADGSDIRSLGGIRAANPAWAPDGRTIAYDDVDGIRMVSAAGGPHEVVAATFAACPAVAWCPILFEPSWSPDGTQLVVHDRKAGETTGDLYVIDLHGKRQTRVSTGQTSGPRWFSPLNAATGTP